MLWYSADRTSSQQLRDTTVRLLKDHKPPLLPQDERARLLVALACVDYVTIFSEATPLALIECLRPHVLVKGGDYTLDTVVGRKEVEAYGERYVSCLLSLECRPRASLTASSHVIVRGLIIVEHPHLVVEGHARCKPSWRLAFP